MGPWPQKPQQIGVVLGELKMRDLHLGEGDAQMNKLPPEKDRKKELNCSIFLGLDELDVVFSIFWGIAFCFCWISTLVWVQTQNNHKTRMTPKIREQRNLQSKMQRTFVLE